MEWARRGEDRGFSSLGTIDRLVYPNYEPLVALAAAAAVTKRVRLTTDILISPIRANTALLAKEALTLDSLSGGRLTLAWHSALERTTTRRAGSTPRGAERC